MYFVSIIACILSQYIHAYFVSIYSHVFCLNIFTRILSQYIHTYFVFINISFIINKTLGKTTFRKT